MKTYRSIGASGGPRRMTKYISYNFFVMYVKICKRGTINIYPPYQRNPCIWPKNHKVLLIEHLFKNLPLPNITLAENEDGETELCDGLQRLSTLIEFYERKLEVPASMIPDEYREDFSIDNETTISYSSLNTDGRRFFEDIDINCCIMYGYNAKERALMFQNMNTHVDRDTAELGQVSDGGEA